jgi:hypothetical protein
MDPPLIILLIRPDLDHDPDLFKYTRGRFVCNEEHEMSQRHVHFNVTELARCAAEAVNAKVCVSIKKYPDGMYNKSMLLSMDNGSRIVAKVPNPNVGLPHLTTASEVATMDFVSSTSRLLSCLADKYQARDVLGIPIPKVLAWCSRAHEHAVGAEYIIMEEVRGIELEQVWPKMSIQDRFAIVKSIASFQKAWTSVTFTKYGSLYFSRDLEDTPSSQPLYTDANGDYITNKAFAIGPSTARGAVHSGKATINFEKGSCKQAN